MISFFLYFSTEILCVFCQYAIIHKILLFKMCILSQKLELLPISLLYQKTEPRRAPFAYSTASRKVADHFAILSRLSSEMLTGQTIWISQMQSVPSFTVT